MVSIFLSSVNSFLTHEPVLFFSLRKENQQQLNTETGGGLENSWGWAVNRFTSNNVVI